jgi:hypothetical protein
MKDVTIVSDGDAWKAIYIDDRLIYEGDSLPLEYVLEKLGVNVKNRISSDADDSGHFPKSLKDFKNLKPY